MALVARGVEQMVLHQSTLQLEVLVVTLMTGRLETQRVMEQLQ